MPIVRPTSSEWNHRHLIQERRIDALNRLYERREAVNHLIQALEDYQKLTPSQQAECIPLRAAAKCS